MDTALILIVEDESIVALDIQSRLENSGYSIAGSVRTGEAAIELVEKLTPDLVLMDIQLKGKLDGIETAEIIRAQFNLPVIFLTAFADEETLRRARVTEPFGFILKPFEELSLAPTIEMALYKHKMEQALRESEARYRSLVETMPDAVFVLDLDFNIRFYNQQAVQMYRFENQQDLLGKNAVDFIAPEDRAALCQDAQTLLSTGENGTAEYTLLRKDGTRFPGEIKASLLRDAAGTRSGPMGIIAISRDLSERKRLEKQASDLLEQVQNLARCDSLTNLYNHRYFYEMAEVEFERSRRYAHPLAVIMLDLDNFKQINDTYGHVVGDQVLRMVADEMQSNLRSVDVLARVGGDEFLVLLPETPPTEALAIANRLSACIKEDFISSGRKNIHVTASLGVAVNVETCANLAAMVLRADQALYTAKRNGRDRVEI
jgi:diguanylate cyclase (GGDEF)-like protein/PAS domain S-box-containing protein